MVQIKNQSEKKRQSPIVGGRCGVVVQDWTMTGRVVWAFYVKNNLQEARELALKAVSLGHGVGICKRSSTNYKDDKNISVHYRVIERLIPDKWQPLKKFETLSAGGWVDVVFNAKTGAARYPVISDDGGALSDYLDALALVMYNGRAVWC